MDFCPFSHQKSHCASRFHILTINKCLFANSTAGATSSSKQFYQVNKYFQLIVQVLSLTAPESDCT